MKFDKLCEDVIPVSVPSDGKDYEYSRAKGGVTPKTGVMLRSPDDYAIASSNNIQKAKNSIQNALRCIPGAKDNSLSTWAPRLKSLVAELDKFPRFR